MGGFFKKRNRPCLSMIIGAEAKLASWGASAYIGRKTGFSFSFFAGFGFYIEFV